MLYDYEDEFGDDDEEPWDAELSEEDRITNPSAEDISAAIELLAEEDEEEPASEDAEVVEDDEFAPESDLEGEDGEIDEFGDYDAHEGEYDASEGEYEEDGDTLGDLIQTPAPRAASIARLRGKIHTPVAEDEEEADEVAEDDIEDDLDGFEEAEESMVAPAPRVRQRQASAGAEEFVPEPEEEPDEPMYDNVGLGGLANAIVGLFSRKRKK